MANANNLYPNNQNQAGQNQQTQSPPQFHPPQVQPLSANRITVIVRNAALIFVSTLFWVMVAAVALAAAIVGGRLVLYASQAILKAVGV